MKKIIIIFIFGIVMTTSLITYANRPITQPTRENVLEDAVIDLLQPQLSKAIEDHYGTTFAIGTFCERVIEIKKLEHPGSWMFEAKMEFVTFTGSHKFKDIFTVTLRQDWETEGWVMQKYDVRKYDYNEKYACRRPA